MAAPAAVATPQLLAGKHRWVIGTIHYLFSRRPSQRETGTKILLKETWRLYVSFQRKRWEQRGAFISHSGKTALVSTNVRRALRLRRIKHMKKKNKHLLFYLHATAWWDFTAISVPGDLWLGETANPRRWDDGPLALRDRLGAFTFLKTSHNCRKAKKWTTST